MKKSLLLVLLLSSCAKLSFTDGWGEGAHFYDSEPYMSVNINPDCTTTSALVMLPTTKRSVILHNGYGSTNLSVALQNGMITSIGQQQDTKVPETINAMVGLATEIPKLGITSPPTCKPQTQLFKIDNGVIDIDHPIKLNIH